MVTSWFEDQDTIGKEVDSYLGVPVYYNGPIYEKSYGKHYSSDGYYYGQKWQCVEFIKRFYHDALDHKMPEVYGHARDFFNLTLPHGAYNAERDLYQYYNGQEEKPEVNDILVFQDSTYGHVAVITKVEEEYIEVIQQNIYGKPREKFDIVEKNGQYSIGSQKKQPVGWLHKK